MDTQLHPLHPPFVFHHMPTAVSRRDCNRSITPHVHRPHKGPKPPLSLYKIFHDILSVLHTGMQWDQLKTKRHALHDTNVHKWHNRWSKEGSYQSLFEASIIQGHHTDQLETSVLHGEGSNTVVTKGAQASATQAINPRKETKS
jgi:hypothetical protein